LSTRGDEQRKEEHTKDWRLNDKRLEGDLTKGVGEEGHRQLSTSGDEQRKEEHTKTGDYMTRDLKDWRSPRAGGDKLEEGGMRIWSWWAKLL